MYVVIGNASFKDGTKETWVTAVIETLETADKFASSLNKDQTGDLIYNFDKTAFHHEGIDMLWWFVMQAPIIVQTGDGFAQR